MTASAGGVRRQQRPPPVFQLGFGSRAIKGTVGRRAERPCGRQGPSAGGDTATRRSVGVSTHTQGAGARGTHARTCTLRVHTRVRVAGRTQRASTPRAANHLPRPRRPSQGLTTNQHVRVRVRDVDGDPCDCNGGWWICAARSLVQRFLPRAPGVESGFGRRASAEGLLHGKCILSHERILAQSLAGDSGWLAGAPRGDIA